MANMQGPDSRKADLYGSYNSICRRVFNGCIITLHLKTMLI